MPNAFSRSTKVFIDSSLSPKAQSEFLAKVAKQGVADLIATKRAPPRYDRFVDGKKDAPEETVKPSGTISYVFEYLNDVIAFSIGYLRTRSPVRKGKYRDSFYVSVNGKAILATDFEGTDIGTSSEIIIYNSQPYARKVDVQLVGYKKLHFSTPADMFPECVQAVKSRFGNLVNVSRIRNVSFPGKYTLRRRQMRPRPRQHLVLRHVGEPVETPGMVITLRGV